MELIVSVTLPDPLFDELMEAAKGCRCTPSQFAAEAIESVIASRRLPHVRRAPHGARIGVTEIDEEAEPEGYPVHLEQL